MTTILQRRKTLKFQRSFEQQTECMEATTVKMKQAEPVKVIRITARPNIHQPKPQRPVDFGAYFSTDADDWSDDDNTPGLTDPIQKPAFVKLAPARPVKPLKRRASSYCPATFLDKTLEVTQHTETAPHSDIKIHDFASEEPYSPFQARDSVTKRIDQLEIDFDNSDFDNTGLYKDWESMVNEIRRPSSAPARPSHSGSAMSLDSCYSSKSSEPKSEPQEVDQYQHTAGADAYDYGFSKAPLHTAGADAYDYGYCSTAQHTAGIDAYDYGYSSAPYPDPYSKPAAPHSKPAAASQNKAAPYTKPAASTTKAKPQVLPIHSAPNSYSYAEPITPYQAQEPQVAIVDDDLALFNPTSPGVIKGSVMDWLKIYHMGGDSPTRQDPNERAMSHMRLWRWDSRKKGRRAIEESVAPEAA